MPRKSNSNSRSLNLIIMALKEAPEGLWPREIARRTNLDHKTVIYYVSRYPEIFEEQSVDGPKKAIFKIIRLRPGALTKPGVLLSKILKEQGL